MSENANSGSDRPLTIGAVPYLNGRPLVRWFWDTEEGRESGIHVIDTVPSQLAVLLEKGEVDVALVSSIELFRAPGLTHVPNVGVVADGAVRSVRLFSQVPIEEIRTVALDTSSLTSVTLVRILLSELYSLTPDYIPARPNLGAMFAEADAGLLIGDPGYRDYPELGQQYILDLGEGWKRLTGLPFVYAAWIGRPESITPALASALNTAKEWGKAHLLDVATAEYERLNETYERAQSYLTEVMHYDVGQREEEALALFGQKAAALKLV